MRGRIVAATAVGVALTGAIAFAEPGNHFPYDPTCAWGRVSDGHGLMVRCITRGEAEALLGGTLQTRAPADRSLPGGAGASAASAPGAAAAVAAPAAEAPASEREPPASPLPPKQEEEKPAPAPQPVAVELGPVIADTGRLPEAVGKLRQAGDRYERCVRENGGLDGASGEVQVRFLVRERGRAEGSTVKQRRGVSEAAARCIAEVVDRRYVGYPDAPVVGATLVVKVSKK